MRFVTVFVSSLAASALSATLKNAAQQASVSPKAFLEKDATKSNCTRQDPNCGDQINVVLKVNSVLEQAVKVEKKAEKAETESKELLETVAETKSAQKEEESMAAAQMAVKEKVETVAEEVKNEDEEIKIKEKVVAAEKEAVATVTNPEAKKAVEKDEEEMKAEVKEEKDEAEVKEREKKTVEKAATVAAISAVASQASVAAKEEQFKAETKSVEKEAKLFDETAIFKVELAVYKVQKEVAKSAEPAGAPTTPGAPPAAKGKGKAKGKMTVAEEISAAELPKLELAIAVVTKAKEEAKEAVVEKETATVEMEKIATLTGSKADQIPANMDTVKRLKTSMKPCVPCSTNLAAKKGEQVLLQAPDCCEREQ